MQATFSMYGETKHWNTAYIIFLEKCSSYFGVAEIDHRIMNLLALTQSVDISLEIDIAMSISQTVYNPKAKKFTCHKQ